MQTVQQSDTEHLVCTRRKNSGKRSSDNALHRPHGVFVILQCVTNNRLTVNRKYTLSF